MINILHPDAFVPTAEEIADIIWLAAHIHASSAGDEQALSSKTLPAQPDTASTSIPPATQFDQSAVATRENSGSAKAEVHLPKTTTAQNAELAGVRAIAFQSPAATALPGKLALARSLRPLLRRIPSYSEFALDEAATAEHIAQKRTVTPVLQPKREHWLDLAVVVDEWQTMVIWRETIREFIELLQQLGAFRTIQTWRLATEIQSQREDGQSAAFRLYSAAGSGNGRGRVCSPGELIEPNGRRLVLVLTDCTSPAWASGAAATLLSTWGAINMVAIAQMLPASLWATSALADGLQVYTAAALPGVSNRQLQVELPWHWLESKLPTSLPIPIVTLEPEALAPWAQMLAGKSGTQTPAIYLPMQPGEYVAEGEAEQVDNLSPEARWQRFRATASPLARELIGYLAAAPLSLPVMRLVQRVMLPQSRQVQLAEIFRSGLIQRLPSFSLATNVKIIHYDFVEGMRDLLLTTILLCDTKKILEDVANYVGQHYAKMQNFHALILDPSFKGNFVVDENSFPFAMVATKVLRRLGGKYIDLAKNIEELYDNRIDTISSSEERTDRNFKTQFTDNNLPAAPHKRSLNPRILIIDNDERIVYYLQTLFSKRGYDVYTAQGVGGAALRQNAIELAQAVRPHVAIVDLRLDDEYKDDPTGLLLLPPLSSARCILYSGYLTPVVLRRVKRQYNVFDWVDKPDIERLYTVVDEAAHQASASRRGLEIQWPTNWRRQAIIEALFKEAPTQPEIEILDDIIAQLFSDSQRIKPETINGKAEEGLRSVVRGRSVIAKIYPDQLQPMVLKLGLARRTHREYENYQTHIHGFLPGLFHTQIEKHTLFWDLGGTVYSFVGAGQQTLPTFTIHYVQNIEANKILAPLRHLFRVVWQPHYEAAVPMTSSSLYAAYDNRFLLEEKLTQIDRTLLPKLNGLVGLPLDPVQWVQTFGHNSIMPTARQAVTHGDLHGDNLFVEEDRAWLIDFERTGPSHALRDFAELEVDIFTRLIPQERVGWATLHRLAEWLVSPTEPGAFTVAGEFGDNMEVQKAFQVISGIRALAHEVVRYSDQRELLWAMLFDSLFVASINAMPETQRLRAILYAAVICERLSHWGEI